VNVIYGSSQGLIATGAQFWQQDSPGVPGIAEADDQFGSSLAAANFGDGEDGDLAVGAPDEDVGGRSNAGVVDVLYGSAAGVTATGAQLWYQGSAGVVGDPEESDRFGYALAAANFGKGAEADLAVGVPDEDEEGSWWEEADSAGAVNVLYGRSSGLSAIGTDWWWQDSSGFDGAVEESNEHYQEFGDSLTAADFGKGSGVDLAVGVPGENTGSWLNPFAGEVDVGGVNVLYSDERGLRASDDQFWWQASDSLHDSAEEFDSFGEILAR
jgi:hypothetical protein